MTKSEFNNRVKLARMRGDRIDAAKLVLVDGLTAYAAAQATNVDQASLSRALKKLQRPICKCCGQFTS